MIRFPSLVLCYSTDVLTVCVTSLGTGIPHCNLLASRDTDKSWTVLAQRSTSGRYERGWITVNEDKPFPLLTARGRKVGGVRYEARSRGRSSLD